MSGKRNYGIDALRMLAMFMVVVLHVLGQGGILNNSKEFTVQYGIAWGFEIVAMCAVNCYALISGYVGVESKYRVGNIIVLWLRVVFYTVIITAIYSIINPGDIEINGWKNALLPVFNGQYWYFTAYFALFLFIPFLNTIINNMEQKKIKNTLIAICVLFSILQMASIKDVFYLKDGYTVLWLMVLYLIGGYIKKYGFLKELSTKKLLLCFGIVNFLAWLLIFTQGIYNNFIPQKYIMNIQKYNSPNVLISGIILLVIFERITFKEDTINVIKKTAPLAFSVYLIHANPIIWSNYLQGAFQNYVNMDWWMEFIAILITALVIYILCLAIDCIRELLFKVLKVKEKVAFIDKMKFFS